MTMKKAKPGLDMKPHPIQLTSLGVRELSIISNVAPDADIEANVSTCSIKIGSTNYDNKDKTIAVSLRLEVGTGNEETEAPFIMKIELVGFFEVDESRFLVEHVSDWAFKNAPFILFPYLREHAFGLSARCGFKPMLLPLLEVQTFKIDKPRTAKPKPATGK